MGGELVHDLLITGGNLEGFGVRRMRGWRERRGVGGREAEVVLKA